MLVIKAKSRRAPLLAFTLTEVIVATGLFAFLFSALYLAIAQALSIIERARENLRATQILDEVSEVVRLYSWTQINGGYVPTAFTNYFDPASTNSRGRVYYGTISISPASMTETYSNDLRQITVTVNWTNKYVGHQRTLQTYVSQYGVQNYVY